jgi:uncharacterized membrane protein YcfT
MMDAFANYMWLSAWAFQAVLLVLVVRVVVAIRKLSGFPHWFRKRA